MADSVLPVLAGLSLLLLLAVAWRLWDFSRYMRFVRLVKGGRLEEAEAMFPSLLRSMPRLVEGGPMLAQASLDVRLLGLPLPEDRVRRFFESLARTGREARPAAPVFLRLEANLLRQQGRLAEGAPLMEEAARLAPEDPVNRQQHAWFQELSGDVDGALEEYHRALDLLESVPPARRGSLRASLLRSMSQCLSRRGRLDEARKALEQAVAQDPCSTEGLFTRIALAGLQERLGRPEEAAATLRGGLERCPDGHPLLRQTLAAVLSRSGRFDEAEAELGQAGEPGTSVRLVRAQIEAGRGRPERALAELEEAAAAEPRNPMVQLALAQHHEREGDDARAMVHLERAVELPAPPGLPEGLARERLGDCYGRIGRWEDAEREYRRALKEGGRNPSLKASLGMLLKRVGRAEEGAALLQEGREGLEEELRGSPDDPRLHQALGTMLLRSDLPEPARLHLRKAVELGPGDFLAWRDLGEAESRAGDPEAARRAWTRALEFRTRPDLERQVRDRLAQGGDSGQISTDTSAE